jgi:hypothetical protein
MGYRGGSTVLDADPQNHVAAQSTRLQEHTLESLNPHFIEHLRLRLQEDRPIVGPTEVHDPEDGSAFHWCYWTDPNITQESEFPRGDVACAVCASVPIVPGHLMQLNHPPPYRPILCR